MKRMLALALLLCGFPAIAAAQVRIDVSVPAEEGFPKIHAIVRNETAQPITVCVDMHYRSLTSSGAAIEATPHPFILQKEMHKGEGDWLTLRSATDFGGWHVPKVIDGGESAEYAFRAHDAGRLRLLLNYWRGAMPDVDCEKKPKGARKVKSKPFDAFLFYTLH